MGEDKKSGLKHSFQVRTLYGWNSVCVSFTVDRTLSLMLDPDEFADVVTATYSLF